MLFEWLFERKNPQPVGTIEGGHPPSFTGRPLFVALRGLVGAALIGWAGYLAVGSSSPLRMLGLLAMYLVVAYFVHPRPDRSNLGVAHGFIDHPFRWSDDKNRILLGLQVILYPGRFAVAAARDVIALPGRARMQRLARAKDVVWRRPE